MPGKKYASLKNPSLYESLRKDGRSKESAARISNAQAAGTIRHRSGTVKDPFGRKKRRGKGTGRKIHSPFGPDAPWTQGGTGA